jgi:hypothetical protein
LKSEKTFSFSKIIGIIFYKSGLQTTGEIFNLISDEVNDMGFNLSDRIGFDYNNEEKKISFYKNGLIFFNI